MYQRSKQNTHSQLFGQTGVDREYPHCFLFRAAGFCVRRQEVHWYTPNETIVNIAIIQVSQASQWSTIGCLRYYRQQDTTLQEESVQVHMLLCINGIHWILIIKIQYYYTQLKSLLECNCGNIMETFHMDYNCWHLKNTFENFYHLLGVITN